MHKQEENNMKHINSRNLMTYVLLCILTILLCTQSLLAKNKLTKLKVKHNIHTEIKLSTKIFSKLDTFESVLLEEADQAFNEGGYKPAFAAYKSFSYEFGKSKALPYALYRMARSLHVLDKRNSAIKLYQNVVDYFPDDVQFAAASMYQQGICHTENGDKNKCVAVWAKMVKDKDYVGEVNSGTALVFLAKEMAKLKKFKEANEFRIRTAINFRKKNPLAAHNAGMAVLYYYVKTMEPKKLKDFWVKSGGVGFTSFGWGHIRSLPKDPSKPDETRQFWDRVLQVANTSLGRKKEDAELRKKVVNFWVSQVGNKWITDEKFQLNLANLAFTIDEDRQKWLNKYETIFKSKPISIARVKQWLAFYRYDTKVYIPFFNKNAKPLAGSLKTFGEKLNFGVYLSHPLRMFEECAVILRAIPTKGLTDEELLKLGAALLERGRQTEDVYMAVFNKIKNKTLIAKYFFDHSYHSRKYANCIPYLPLLKKSPKYSQGISWQEAYIYHQVGRYPEAIKAYRAANKQPDSTWGVIQCQILMTDYPKAIATAKGLQMVGGATATRACYQIADIYKLMGQKGKEIEQLRIVLHRHAGTREASGAHQRLEGYGVKLVGGVSKAKE